MQFIKKLVILTGSGAHGTLMLEKNGFDVRCKLTLFGLSKGAYRLVVISDGLFVTDVSEGGTTFRLGEINMEQIHAAVIGDRVIAYGSNCAQKLTPSQIMDKVREQDAKVGAAQSKITYSGAELKPSDYFMQIAPVGYNDFAIAEKNFYPAHLSLVGEDEAENKEEASDAQTEDQNTNTQAVPVGADTQYAQEAAVMQSEYENLDDVGANLCQEAAATTQNAEQEAQQKPQLDSEKKEQEPKMGVKSLRECASGHAPVGRRATYFERSRAQIERVIQGGERFAELERLIPGSRFVKVNYDTKRFYIVGVIGCDYICYGVPAAYSPQPPSPLTGYARWLPLPLPHRIDGFWMMYQDGVTGETLRNN
ncbi:MAG: hypothetical protein E7350_00425 [Clostridiales bacterium]|nr:hypothetical protein [Clostridiales bacterium]